MNLRRKNAQREADNILKYYKKESSTANINSQGRRATQTNSTHFYSYADALTTKNPTTNLLNNITKPIVSNQRPLTVSFFNTTPSSQSSYRYLPPTTYKFTHQENKSVYEYTSPTSLST